MSRKTEDQIQSECYVWFNNTYKKLRGCLFAVPNGGARSALQGKIFKMTGVYSGVADMLFMYKGKTYCIEMKNIYGCQSEKQIEWEKHIKSQGFCYYVIRDLKSFKILINQIIANHLIDEKLQ